MVGKDQNRKQEDQQEVNKEVKARANRHAVRAGEQKLKELRAGKVREARGDNPSAAVRAGTIQPEGERAIKKTEPKHKKQYKARVYKARIGPKLHSCIKLYVNPSVNGWKPYNRRRRHRVKEE